MNIEIGPNTATSTTQYSSTVATEVAWKEPAISSRMLVTTTETGFTSTTGSSQLGMVLGSTKMFEANVSGIRMNMEMPIAACSVRTAREMTVHTQDRLKLNTRSRANATSTPQAPPSGRNPITNPTARMITPARV